MFLTVKPLPNNRIQDWSPGSKHPMTSHWIEHINQDTTPKLTVLVHPSDYEFLRECLPFGLREIIYVKLMSPSGVRGEMRLHAFKEVEKGTIVLNAFQRGIFCTEVDEEIEISSSLEFGYLALTNRNLLEDLLKMAHEKQYWTF